MSGSVAAIDDSCVPAIKKARTFSCLDAALQAQIDANAAKIKELNVATDGLLQEVDMLKTGFKGLEVRMDSIEVEFKLVQVDVDANKAAIRVNTERIAGMKEKLMELNVELDVLSVDVVANADKIATLKDAILNLEAELDAEMAQLQSNIDANAAMIKSQAAELKAAIEDWVAFQAKYAVDKDAILVQIGNLEAFIADLQGQIDANTVDIAAANSDLIGALAQLTQLNSQMTSLNSSYVTLLNRFNTHQHYLNDIWDYSPIYETYCCGSIFGWCYDHCQRIIGWAPVTTTNVTTTPSN